MNRDRLFAAIHADLQAFVQANKGELSIAADPYHLLELLVEAPSGWRAVLHYAGDDGLSDHALAGSFRENAIEIGVTCNPGLVIDRDAALFEARPGSTPALMRLCDLIEDRVRSLRLTSGAEDVGEYFHYRGARPAVMPDGIPLRGYLLRFTLDSAPTQLGEVDYRTVAVAAA